MSGQQHSAMPTLRRILASAHRRVIIVSVLMVGLPLILGGFAVIRGYAERNLLLIANAASYAVEPAVVFGDAEAIHAGMRSVTAAEDVNAIEVWNTRRQLLARWQPPADTAMARLEQWGGRLLWPTPIIHPVRHQDTVIAEIRIYGSAGGMGRYVVFGALVAVLTLGATFLVTRGIAARLQNGIVTPLARFAEVAHAVRAQRRFDRRVPLAGVAEIDQLVRDFNILLAELDGWHTGLRLENEKLVRQATHDSLTGLGNRALFERAVKKAIAEAREEGGAFAVLYIDANGFKQINDHYGHDAGDAVLQVVAARLRAGIRQIDTAFRLGGDEFTVLLGAVADRATISAIVSRIAAAMDEAIVLPGGDMLTPSLSFGAALYPDDGETMRELVSHADSEMYKDKRLRRSLKGDGVH